MKFSFETYSVLYTIKKEIAGRELLRCDLCACLFDPDDIHIHFNFHAEIEVLKRTASLRGGTGGGGIQGN